MNYRTMVKGALALSLSLTVASAFAASTTYNDVQAYGATFENAVNTTVGELNDYAYQPNSGITNQNYRDEQAAKGWFAGSADDESKIIERVVDNVTQQALQLNTDANTLTNKFASGVAGAVNTAIANQGTAFFETEVKFVASDTLDAGIAGGQDATKFAIYAYCNDTPPEGETCTTNLVVFHAYEYEDEHGDIVTDYTNEVCKSVLIDTEVYTKLRVEMKRINVAEEGEPAAYQNVFSVSVNGGEPISSTTAKVGGIWFQTTENVDLDEDNADVSSLNFKGTGEIDNISVGTITETTKYAIDWTDSVNVVVSNNNAQLTADQTNFVAGAVLTFYPTEGAITNVNGEAVANLASYEYTVGTTDTNLVVLAGEDPATPTYAVSWTVDKVVVSNTTDSAAIGEAVAGSFEAGTKLTFYPEEGTITNLVVNGLSVDPLPAGAYEYTVLAQDNQTIVAKAGSEPVGRILPEWAQAADATKFWTWVDKYSVQYATDYTAQYLMNVDPSVTPVLQIDSIEVTAEGSQIVVSAAAGETAINLADINGVLNVSVGSSLANLTSKDPDKNATFADNKATIIIKAADGAFAKATVDFTAAATKLSQVSQ